MECGRLTAKLRDAVPVIFIEEGREPKRYRNIEIPDEIKELEYKDFKLDVPETGQITFKIFFDPGVLPEVWPEARTRKHRVKSSEGTTIDANGAVEEERTQEQNAPEGLLEASDAISTEVDVDYHVSGERRKELVNTLGELLEAKPEYLGMPTGAYRVGAYQVSMEGVLSGPDDPELIEALAANGFEIA